MYSSQYFYNKKLFSLKIQLVNSKILQCFLHGIKIIYARIGKLQEKMGKLQKKWANQVKEIRKRDEMKKPERKFKFKKRAKSGEIF